MMWWCRIRVLKSLLLLPRAAPLFFEGRGGGGDLWGIEVMCLIENVVMA